MMFALTGITGQVGGAMADVLMQRRLPVRAVVRDADNGAGWAAQGCEMAIAQMNDPRALAEAFNASSISAIVRPLVSKPMNQIAAAPSTYQIAK